MDEGPGAARIVAAMLVVSLFSLPVLADDDAGSGGDAGDSSSSATSLNATNATYYGNLSSGDEDWYSIQIPAGMGLSASLYGYLTSNDFDLYLYDSAGYSIDYSWYDDPNEEVTSNGTSIGNTTVTLWVDAFQGSGVYNLQIWIFPENQGPAQNDAATGSDAGDTPSTATQITSTNQTFDGWISDTWDDQDWYNISIPSGHGIHVSMIFQNGTSSYTQLSLIESTATTYINYDYYDPYEVTSNGTNVGGDTVYIRVYTTGNEGNYSLTINLFSTAGQPGSNQDDAGSGGDAGDALGTALAVNMTGNTTTFEGWVDENWDETDYYSLYVPANWTSWASLSWSNTSADLDLYLYSSSGSILDSSTSFTDNPEEVSGNASSVGGSTVYFRVIDYSGLDVYYNLTLSISNLSDSPAFNQNDANSGGDAGNDFASSLALPSNNGSYSGWISDTSDYNDVYSIQVPSGQAIEAELWWGNSANDFDLGLYDESQSLIDSSTSDNPEEVGSGSSDVSNTTVYVLVQSYSGSWSNGGEGNYSLNISLVNQSAVPGLNQDDAYSGGDAGDTLSNATPLVNATPVFSVWPGYADSGSDDYDYYQVYVPVDHGITVELSPGYISGSTMLVLTLYDSSNSQVDVDYYSNPQSVSTNGTGTNLGGTNAFIGVWAYNGGDMYNMSIWLFSLDADGDGFYDDEEYSCGSDPNDNTSTPSDIDADGICDPLDEDMDGDGVDNANDSFAEDANETTDSDGDGIGDNGDPDDDNDGWTDSDEYSCGTDHNDSSSMPSDLDSDGTCDVLDDDIDGDGYGNSQDQFDYDPSEWNDTDSDGIGDNSDGDDDGDGYYDGVELDCLSDPLDHTSIPADTDSDGVCDELDDDVDGDGTTNDLDDFPDSADESTDSDGDGIGDNADPDDDNDGWDDSDELDCGTNPFLPQSSPDDWDNDRICDNVDPDDDNDAWNDTIDAFPYDPSEWDDLDLDNLGSELADSDDDGDGWDDADEQSICNTDPRDANSIPDDFDGDRICDNLDDDDDNDLVLDFDDAFPYDPTETKDTDGDGQGDGDDTDDDNDGWPDVTEVSCDTPPLVATEFPDDNDGDGTCDLNDPDDDNDGIPDLDDAFPMDPTEWVDRNSDGLGDNAHPLTTMDHMRLNPEITIVGIGILAALFSGTVAFAFGRRGDQDEFDEDEGWEEGPEDDFYEDWEDQY